MRMFFLSSCILLLLGVHAVAAPVELALLASDTDNVFYPDEDKSIVAEVRNTSDGELTATLELSGVDEQGKSMAQLLPVTLAAGQTSRLTFPIDQDEPCFMAYTVRVRGESGELMAEKDMTLAVIRPPVADIAFEDAFYGFAFCAKPETAARVGGRFIRTIIHWKFSNPSPGEYRLREFIDQGRRAEAVGIGMIYAFSVHNRPDWLEAPDEADLTSEENLDRFQEWIEMSVSQFANGPRAVEINNEPDLELGRSPKLGYLPGATLGADLLKLGYESVKAIDPTTPVLGGGVSGVDFNNNLTFARQLLIDADGDIDYFSPHPYADSRYIRPGDRVSWPDEYPLREKLAAAVTLAQEYTVGQEVWSSEIGWAVPESEFSISPLTRDWAAITAQALILFKTIPGVSKCTWHNGQIDWRERGMNYSIFVRESRQVPNWHPLPPVNAYATVTSLLEGSETGRKLDLGPAVEGYAFNNGITGQCVVALWSRKHDIYQQGKLPAGAALIDMYGREREADTLSPLMLTRAPVFVGVALAQQRELLDALQASSWRPKHLVTIETVAVPEPGQLSGKLENLWHEPVSAKVMLAGTSKEVTLVPGVNQVSVPYVWPDTLTDTITLPVSVELADETVSADFSHSLVTAQYADPGTVSVDGVLSAEEEKLLNERLEARDYVLPPDPAIPWEGADDLSVRYGYAWNETGLYFLAVVRDDVMTPLPASEGAFWNYDSLQITFVPGAEGAAAYGPGDRELGLALTETGECRFYQTHPIKGDLLTYPAAISRGDGETLYEFFIPWSYLYGDVAPAAGTVLSANFILNENDGNGRSYWMGPADGIATGKRTDSFPWVLLRASSCGQSQQE